MDLGIVETRVKFFANPKVPLVQNRATDPLCVPQLLAQQIRIARAPAGTVRGHRRDTTKPCLA